MKSRSRADRSASANVWRLLERLPGFNRRMRIGRAQLRAGKKVLFEGERSDVGNLGTEEIYTVPGGGITVASRSQRRRHIEFDWSPTREEIKAIYDELGALEAARLASRRKLADRWLAAVQRFLRRHRFGK